MRFATSVVPDRFAVSRLGSGTYLAVETDLGALQTLPSSGSVGQLLLNSGTAGYRVLGGAGTPPSVQPRVVALGAVFSPPMATPSWVEVTLPQLQPSRSPCFANGLGVVRSPICERHGTGTATCVHAFPGHVNVLQLFGAPTLRERHPGDGPHGLHLPGVR